MRKKQIFDEIWVKKVDIIDRRHHQEKKHYQGHVLKLNSKYSSSTKNQVRSLFSRHRVCQKLFFLTAAGFSVIVDISVGKFDVMWILLYSIKLDENSSQNFHLMKFLSFTWLTHFFPMFPFYTPCKHKTEGFLIFSGDMNREYWEEMVQIRCKY